MMWLSSSDESQMMGTQLDNQYAPNGHLHISRFHLEAKPISEIRGCTRVEPGISLLVSSPPAPVTSTASLNCCSCQDNCNVSTEAGLDIRPSDCGENSLRRIICVTSPPDLFHIG